MLQSHSVSSVASIHQGRCILAHRGLDVWLGAISAPPGLLRNFRGVTALALRKWVLKPGLGVAPDRASTVEASGRQRITSIRATVVLVGPGIVARKRSFNGRGEIGDSMNSGGGGRLCMAERSFRKVGKTRCDSPAVLLYETILGLQMRDPILGLGEL